MTEDQENKVYTQQDAYITEHFGRHAAQNANYGWAVDENDNTIGTKVYGYGILTSTVHSDTNIQHHWEPI